MTSQWKPEGYSEVEATLERFSDIASRNRSYEDRGQWEKCDRKGLAAAREQVAQLTVKYPAARTWIAAEDQARLTHYSDPCGKAAAAEKAMTILRDGGSVEEAKVALAERYEGTID